MHFTVAGQCIGNDNSVSALILKEQLEQPVVTKSLQKPAGVAQNWAAGL